MPPSPATSKNQEPTLKKEIKNWVDNDVRWIIGDDEMAALKQLSNQDEFDNFVEQFWLRRDPTPDTPENEFREEHYRRIAYANEHFAAGKKGSLTDRGQIYIKFGPPDEIEAHPSGRHLRPSAGRRRRHHLHLPLRSNGAIAISKASGSRSSSSSWTPACAATIT